MKVGRAEVGPGHPLLLIAGPCVIEGEAQTLAAARKVADVAQRHGLPAVFKCSFDKANRTSAKSFRGPGVEQGLRVLARVKQETGLPVLTDVHEPAQCARVAEVADVLQIPAFLCRQTDLLLAAGAAGRAVNVKKGQFLAPADMQNVVAKLHEAGCRDVLVTERGTTFGYHDLVVDFRGLVAMRKLAPVCFDATHSVQQPGGQGDRTGGDRTLAPPLARAAAAVGIDALFCEVHEDPDRALSDGPNSLTFAAWEQTVADVQRIRRAMSAG
jgi:2-dehydro-3-deoxyphosphooctonate aldolase (KDO 8-P synthase)